MTLMDTFTDLAIGIALETWNIFLDTAPYLFFGFGVAGFLHIFIPDDKIINYLGATAGITNNLLVKDKQDSVESFHANTSCSSCCNHSESEIHGFTHRILMGIRYAYLELPGEISRWLIFGIFLAGIISYMIPEGLINRHLSGGLSSMIIMLLAGILLYICATASTPLAAAMIAKGASPGAAFVFLLAGPATNAATITMVIKFLGLRSASLYLAMIAIISVAFGLLLDFFYLEMGVATTSIAGSASDLVSQEVKTVFAFLMLLIIAYAMYKA